ncbi:MAG: TetR/AcrR family transcriptional regulator [Usitatibacter sp.]
MANPSASELSPAGRSSPAAAGAARPRGRPRSFDREQALERAMDVFWEKGYESASLSELTQAMGINPPSLYAAFGDKERLFLEAMERYYRLQREPITSAYDEEPTARGAVSRVLAEAACQLAKSGHNRGCMMVMAATTCSSASPELKSALAERRATSRIRLKARLDRAVQEGELPRGTDTAGLAAFYTAVLQGMSLQAREGASRKSLLATAETAMRAWPARAGRGKKPARRVAASI